MLCLLLCLTIVATSGGCGGWRQTSQCKATGPRQSDFDASCTTPISPGRSGFCECTGSDGASKMRGFNCGHLPLLCLHKCAEISASIHTERRFSRERPNNGTKTCRDVPGCCARHISEPSCKQKGVPRPRRWAMGNASVARRRPLRETNLTAALSACRSAACRGQAKRAALGVRTTPAKKRPSAAVCKRHPEVCYEERNVTLRPKYLGFGARLAEGSQSVTQLRRAGPIEWPPRVTLAQLLARAPPEPPYLQRRAIPPVEIGSVRSLFVDDFLLERRTAARRYHQAVFKATVLAPEAGEWVHIHKRKNPEFELAWVGRARPYSGGAWWDDRESLYKLFYSCAWDKAGCCGAGRACLALSRDGVAFWKPKISSKVAGLPNMLDLPLTPDQFTVVIDRKATDARWKLLARDRGGEPAVLCTSAAGFVWKCDWRSGPITDRASFFYNPYSEAWAFSLRHNACVDGGAHPGKGARVSRYAESASFQKASWAKFQNWRFSCEERSSHNQPAWNLAADAHGCGGGECDLYQLDATLYESVLVGQAALLHGTDANRTGFLGHCKDSRVSVSYSRDGFHWSHADVPRRPFFDWQLKYQQPVAGNFLLSPDGSELYVYQSGARGCKLCNRGKERVAGTVTGVCAPSAGPPVTFEETSMEEITTLSTLRRDGFCSLYAPDDAAEADAITRPLVLRGASLLVNAKCAEGGYVRAALLGATEAAAVAGFGRDESVPVTGDALAGEMRWRGGANLPVGGQAARLAFYLRRSDLYSFWLQ